MKPSLLPAIFAAGLLTFSCSDPESNPQTPEIPEKPETTTGVAKVKLPSDGPLSIYKWSSSDKMIIGGETYTLSEGEGTDEATFNGNPITDRFYTIAYPSTVTSIDKYLECSFESQEQNGNGSVSHLCNTFFIEDVTACADIEPSKAWAEANEGTFRSSGVIAFDLSLPAEAGSIKSITLQSAGIKFPLDNSGKKTTDKLTLPLKNVTPGSSALEAFIAVPEPKVQTVSGLKLTAEGTTTYSVMIDGQFEIGGGTLTSIKVAENQWTVFSAVQGAGTEASPYILCSPQHMEQMKDLLVEGKTVWFELGADIDMSEVLGWEPLNNINPFGLGVHFDGKDHTISNFACKDKVYCSFFGVLNGTCANVTFDNASITMESMSSSTGVVAGYLGATNNISSTVENVHVTNSSITATYTAGGAYAVGGLGGTAVYSTISNCSFDGTIMSKAYGGNGTETYPDRCPAGGIAARLNTSSSITGCSSSGTITTEKGRYVGGIAGWVSPNEDIRIKSCTNNATVTGGSDRVGGIVGHFQQGVVENCVNRGTISANCSGNTSASGGIVGLSGPSSIIDCRNEGKVTGTKWYIGGILGTSEGKTTIERCCSTGDVIGTIRYVGGIAGSLLAKESVIRNCWTSGKVESSDQDTGGIIGTMMMGQTVSCCYSTAAIKAPRVVGGIAGRASNAVWVYTDTHGNTVEKCIAWNPSITATSKGDVNTTGGSGVVVGFTSFNNTLTNCWRSPSVAFSASDTTNNVACDQPDCSPANPFVMGVTPGTAGKYGCPYHGKAASQGTTASSVATSLGWDTSVWDLSDDLPKLK